MLSIFSYLYSYLCGSFSYTFFLFLLYKIEVFMILNGYEHVDRTILFSLKKDSRTIGYEVTLVNVAYWISGSTLSHRGE